MTSSRVKGGSPRQKEKPRAKIHKKWSTIHGEWASREMKQRREEKRNKLKRESLNTELSQASRKKKMSTNSLLPKLKNVKIS